MSDGQSWEAKKDEVWKRIVELEGSVKDLSGRLGSVKALAESRVSVDEKTANDAAKKAVDGAKRVKEAADVVAGLSSSIEQLKKSLPDVLDKVGQVTTMYQDGKRDKELSEAILKEFKALQDSLKNILDNAKKQGDEVSAKVQIVGQQAQNVNELKTQTANNAAEVKACSEKSISLKAELQSAKNDFDNVLATAKDSLSALHDAKEEELNAVVKEKTELLDALKEEKSAALDEIVNKLEFEIKPIIGNYVRQHEQLYEALEGDPVTIRYLDPPLHEFVPTEEADIKKAIGEKLETNIFAYPVSKKLSLKISDYILNVCYFKFT